MNVRVPRERGEKVREMRVLKDEKLTFFFETNSTRVFNLGFQPVYVSFAGEEFDFKVAFESKLSRT